MNTGKKQYDLIVSLGGNCAAAHNLRFRDMRPFSLPFDWVFMTDTRPVSFLKEGFSNDFKKFFLKENLVRQEGDNVEHGGKPSYRDTYSGYIFPNHFLAPIEKKGAYEDVALKMRRRLNRLTEKISKSRSILFILATGFVFDIAEIKELSDFLTGLYPDKRIDFEIMQFNAPQQAEETWGNLHIRLFVRRMNDYDFKQTNYEWAFLDNIVLPDKKKNGWRCSTKLFGRNFVLRLMWERYK